MKKIYIISILLSVVLSCATSEKMGNDGEISFSIISNTYPESPYKEPSEDYFNLINAVNNSATQFTFHMGNLINAGIIQKTLRDSDVIKQIKDQKKYLSKLSSVVHICRGEMDSYKNNEIFNKLFVSQLYYSFNCGAYHIIVIDTNEENNKMSLKQLIWLESDLKKSSIYRNKILFMRDSIVKPNGWQHRDLIVHSQAIKLKSICKQYGIQTVISASSNDIFDETIDEIRYLNLPTAPLSQRTGKREFNYHIVSINDNHITIKNMRL